MAINLKQGLGAAVVAVSVIAISTTQMTTLFGPDAAAKAVAAAVMLNGMLGGWIMLIGGDLPPNAQAQQLLQAPGGQSAMVRSVLAMKGVENIDVNRSASPELAQLAVDPSLPKIAATPDAQKAVTATAAAAPPPPAA